MWRIYRIGRNVIGLLLSLLLTSCENEEQYILACSYTHCFPDRSASKQRPIYVKTMDGLDKSYALHYNGCLIVGKAAFTHKPLSRDAYVAFGKKVGADIVLVSYSNRKEVVKYRRESVLDKEIQTADNEVAVKGVLRDVINKIFDDEDKPRWKDKWKHRNKQTMIYKYVDIPYREIHYDQAVWFLKKPSYVKAPWEYNAADFTFQPSSYTTDPYIGDWVHYQMGRVKLLATEDSYVAFIDRDKKYRCKERKLVNKRLKWKVGDMKLRVNKQTKEGWYLDGDKIPLAVSIALNQFNYLDIVDRQRGKIILSLKKR